MAIKLENKQNVDAPTGTYPYGNIKNETGLNDGTPVDVNTYADFHQFFAKLLDESNLTPNGLPENAINGFQYFDALQIVANRYKTVDLYGINTVLTTAAYGKLSIAFSASDTTITLPAISATESTQRLAIAKIGGPGVCSVLLNGSDISFPSENVILNDGDSVVFVNAIFGWIVETVKRKAPYPANVFASGTVTLTEKEMRKINIINYAGNTTVNLPALTADYSGQIIAFQKQQGGVATLVVNGSDIIYPSTTVTLEDGDTCILINILGAHWLVLSRFDASVFAAVPDSWHVIGGGGEPAFQNSWVNVFGGTQQLEFKKVDNVVTIRGTVANAGSVLQTIFTLPAGYLPLNDTVTVCGERGAVDTYKKLFINSGTGDVIFDGAAGSNKSFYINMTFRLD